MELIIIILAVLFIVWRIGCSSSSKDYDSAEYHKDWEKDYGKWKMRGVDDNVARNNSFLEVQKKKDEGEYDK